MDRAVPHPFTLPTLAELRALAEICALRLPLREAESRRVARVRDVVAAGSDLSRSIASHTHTLLVDCQGSHGIGDLVGETARLHASLARYSGLVSALVHDYRGMLNVVDAGTAEMLIRSELLAHPVPLHGDGQAALERAV